MVHEVNESLQILVAIVKVAFPTGQEVRHPRAEYRADEYPFERLLAVVYVVQQTTDYLVIAQVPVVTQLRRHVQNVVELAQKTDRAVVRHRDVMKTQGRLDYPLAHVVPRYVLG